jgi:flavin-dependent dehydrogenase
MSMPLFEQLGLRANIEAIGVIKRGADFPANNSAGYRVFRFVDSLNPTWPHAVQVLREELDEVLFRAASDAGADARQGVTVTSVAIDAKTNTDSDQMPGISATALDAQGRALRISAKYLIDATGRDTFLARQLRLRSRHPRHKSAALFAHFTGVERRPGDDAGNISIYRTTNGWAWVIPLPGNLTSIGLVVGREGIRARTNDAGAFLLARLREIEGLRDRISSAQIKGNVQATGNYSYRVDRIVDDRWIMAGDAAGFIDPIFSSGVHIALESGIKAAELVNAALHDPRRMCRARRRYTRTYRSGVRRIEWFIERFNSPVMRYLFANPRKVLGVYQAIISVLAGDLHRDQGLAWRLAVFKLIYHLHNAARISGLWKLDSHACFEGRSMDSWQNLQER